MTLIDTPAACRDLKEGTYCPAVSLYTLPDQAEGATVTLNFGECLRGRSAGIVHVRIHHHACLLRVLIMVFAGAGPDFQFKPPPVEGCPPAKPISDLSTQGGDVKIASQHQKPLVLAGKAPSPCHRDDDGHLAGLLWLLCAGSQPAAIKNEAAT